MNLSDTVELLQVASAYDPLLGRKNQQDALNNAKMWCQILHPKMSKEQALKFVIEHYQTNSRTVTAADINALFKLHRRKLREQADARQRELEAQEAKPGRTEADRERVRQMIAQFRREPDW